MTADRDELARLIARSLDDMTEQDWPSVADYYRAEMVGTADVLWAAGWRKKPSAAELVLVLAENNGLSYGERAEAILALMDGPTDTGEN